MLDRFAEQLRKARLKKGVSLQQMAAKTRIDFKYLEAIDNGNFSFLPDLYVKAFIKQYAKAIDLNEQETIKKFEAVKSGKIIEDDEPKSLLEQKIEISKSRPESGKEKQMPVFDGTNVAPDGNPMPGGLKMKLRVFIYAAGIVLAGVIIFFAFMNRSSTIVVEELPYEKVLEETNKRYQVEEKIEETAANIINPDSLTLQFVNADSLDSAWVMVIYDDLKKEDFLLYPKNTKTVHAADNFKFTLGNSGVILLRLDNQLLNFEGKRGSVRHYEITKKGIQRLTSPPILKIE
jgi:transcriptional regulator with XRE-family HTH domain